MIKNPSQAEIWGRGILPVFTWRRRKISFTEVHLWKNLPLLSENCPIPQFSTLGLPSCYFSYLYSTLRRDPSGLQLKFWPQSRFQTQAPSCFGGCEFQPCLTLTPTKGLSFECSGPCTVLWHQSSSLQFQVWGPERSPQAWRLFCSFVDRSLLHQSFWVRKAHSWATWLDMWASYTTAYDWLREAMGRLFTLHHKQPFPGHTCQQASLEGGLLLLLLSRFSRVRLCVTP